MNFPQTTSATQFETHLEISVESRPIDQADADWQAYDQGPGIIQLAEGFEYCVRARNIDNNDLAQLCKQLAGCRAVTYLNLAENRKITDEGVVRIAGLPWLTRLNLSSCTIHNSFLATLTPLKKLRYLDLSYCNHLGDESLRALKSFQNLIFLDVQGCIHITHAGVRRTARRGLTVHQ